MHNRIYCLTNTSLGIPCLQKWFVLICLPKSVGNGHEIGLVRSSQDAVIASGNSIFGSSKSRKIFTSDNEVFFTKEDAKVFLFL